MHDLCDARLCACACMYVCMCMHVCMFSYVECRNIYIYIHTYIECVIRAYAWTKFSLICMTQLPDAYYLIYTYAWSYIRIQKHGHVPEITMRKRSGMVSEGIERGDVAEGSSCRPSSMDRVTRSVSESSKLSSALCGYVNACL